MPRARAALWALVLACLLVGCQSGTPAAPAAVAPFYNPLNGLNGPDPWLQYYDGNYYLTATQTGTIRMWKAPTLAGLAVAQPTTIWSDSTSARCCNMWAPEFHLLDGPDGQRWYLYYTAGTDGTLDNQRLHVLESSGVDPLGPYTYKSRMFDPSNDGWAIDGSVLKMPDGKLYLLFSSWVGPDQSLFIAPMSNPWTVSGSRVLLSKPTYAWEKALANVNEGPEVLQHDGKIFIVYSASACWGPDYKLGMLAYTGGDVLSAAAWTKQPKPVFERSDANAVFGPGHNGFFSSPDGKENWIVYHANSASGDACTGTRTTRVQKFTWNADGTPNFGAPLSLDTPIAPPSGERAAAPAASNLVYYTVISKNGEQCLDVAGEADAAPTQQHACTGAPSQQWSLDYLGNGAYRLLNRGSGKALEVAGGPDAAADGAKIQQAAWAHGAQQQWRLTRAADGWVRVEARHSGKALSASGCTAGGAGMVQAAGQTGNDCQLFRLQPADAVAILNADNGKALAIGPGAAANSASIGLWSDTGAAERTWKLVHAGDGYYQLMASRSGVCLEAGAAQIAQQSCSAAASEQWRVDALNDGTVRLVARSDGKVVDVANCRMADGTKVQLWIWLNNPCQRFRLAVP